MSSFTGQTAQFLAQLPYSQELRPAYSHVITYIRFAHRDAEEGVRWAHLFGERARAHGDVRAIGQSHQYAGIVYQSDGDLDSAVVEYEESLVQYAEIGDARHVPRAQRSLVELNMSQGRLEQAREYTERLVAYQEDLPWSGVLMREAYWLLGRVLGTARLGGSDRGTATALDLPSRNSRCNAVGDDSV